jgi:peptide/nickel transport system permease protein
MRRLFFVWRASVRRHLVRRLALLLPTLLGVSFVTFALLRFLPGDPAQVMLGEHATAEQIAHFRAEQGLDQPIPVQYLAYLARLARGDLGRSIVTNLPVLTEIGQRLPATIELSLGAMLTACLIGLPLGVVAAYRRNSLIDLIASSGTLLGVSMPLFWLGLLLSYLLGYRLGWLPPSGRLTLGTDLPLITHFYVLDSILAAQPRALADTLRHLILPSLTLSTVPLAIIVRMTRSCLLEELAQDHIRTAHAKGLTDTTILLRHAMKNALPAIITTLGLQLGGLFSGAILTETIFSWPGMGQLTVDRVLARDYPIVQGIVLVATLLFVLINLATDICTMYLNPRIRYE